MLEISRQDPIISSIIGKQNVKDSTHRWFSYVLRRSYKEGLLLYNVLTCELVFIKNDINNGTIRKQLIEKWFLVPYDFNDYEFAKKNKALRQLVYKAESNRNRNKAIEKFWILTTTDCNARCFYCHENGIPKMHMNIETANQIVEYIKKQGLSKINIMWYGGEPLLNFDVINYITEKLCENGIDIESGMISNGILFDENMIKSAAVLWKLRRVQITLDGTEVIYNKVKGYTHFGKESPYKIVMNNIQLLLEHNINVQIRLNLDMHNKDDLFELVDNLYYKFNRYKNFSMYSAPLFEECLGTSLKRSLENRKKIYEIHYELSEKIRNLDVLTRSGLPKTLKSQMRCIATSNARVIFPDGQFAFCHDYAEDIFGGHITGEEAPWEKKLEYTICIPDSDTCKVCVKYPQCVRLEKCFNNKCNSDLIREWIWATKNEMVWEYELFLSKTK